MIHQKLIQELQRVARRYRTLFDWVALSVVWLTIALAGSALLATQWRTGWTSVWSAPMLAVATLVSTGAALWLGARLTRDPVWVARKIEAKHPELGTLLLAAIEQQAQAPDGKLGFLQTTVIRDALAHCRRTNWQKNVPTGRIRGVQLAGVVTLTLLLVVIGGLADSAEQSRLSSGHPQSGDPSSPATLYDVTVAPGDTEIERGTSLVVTARFADNVPAGATLVCRESEDETIRVPMSLSLSDPMFGARVVDVQSDLSYKVQYASASTREYRVRVYEHPQLLRADADLVFPDYTSLERKRVEDTRRITAVVGTELTLYCDLNKPVESARLVGDDGTTLDLTAAGDDPTLYLATQTLDASRRYRLQLLDAEGRSNKEPPEFVFNVTPNRRPDLRLAAPARDVRVSPIEELQTKASLWDDFGLTSYGVSYTLPGNPPQEVALGQESTRNERREIEHLIEFEALDAKPDQLLAYYFWAEDIGPNGQSRRTMGDMYFAEVRHFEEIFRQGQQPPGGQSPQQQQDGQQQGGQNAQQAEQLAELQKQIINATWTIIRRETNEKPTDEYVSDVQELQTAQRQAIEKLAELAGRLEDAQSQQYASGVETHMTDALTHLTDAGQSSPAALQPALASEQAAYQALLRLRARQHEVIRGRQQQSGMQQSGSASGPQSRAQQQLDQLQLKDSENRYETQRQASSQQQEQEKRETLQVLNRLRELARRQSDLNKRLKELQSALEEAETEREREEIQEQLKRLREQQQQLLRDVDELAERMERPENQERMSQSRQQLEETRENIRQTTEALREGQVSRAVANGTRAQRHLEQMREDFRKAASNRFEDDVRQLREGAQELHENETELAQRLENLNRPKPDTRTLRDADDREAISEGFRQQREDLQRLLEDIRTTVEEAEEAEPLMTRQLYDAVRQARHEHVDDALDVTREMLRRGFADQARMAEQQAARGIKQLKEGVDTAAESVLGDEDEALRRAHQTLAELANQLNEEMRRATGQSPEGGQDPSSDAERRAPGEHATSQEEQESQRQPGQQAEGQPRDDDRQRAGQGQRDGGQPPGRRQQDGQPLQGSQPGSGQRPGEEPAEQQQDQPGQRTGRTPGEPTEQGDRPSGKPSASTQQESGNQPAGSPSARGQQDGGESQRPTGPTSLERFRRPDGPMTGDFVPWSDALRDVEEMLDEPELRTETARIRDAARGMRREMRRDFKGPNWDLVREFVAVPLNELRDRVAEELLRRQSGETLVPIDRDPVPPKYADQVRRYYEQLGSGQ